MYRKQRNCLKSVRIFSVYLVALQISNEKMRIAHMASEIGRMACCIGIKLTFNVWSTSFATCVIGKLVCRSRLRTRVHFCP